MIDRLIPFLQLLFYFTKTNPKLSNGVLRKLLFVFIVFCSKLKQLLRLLEMIKIVEIKLEEHRTSNLENGYSKEIHQNS
jgi:hypothetical protein